MKNDYYKELLERSERELKLWKAAAASWKQAAQTWEAACKQLYPVVDPGSYDIEVT